MERAEASAELDTGDAAGKPDEQVALANEDAEPTDAAGWIARGRDLYEQKRMEEALAAFDHAVELAPEDAETWAWRGAVLTRLGQHEEALAAHTRAMDLKPTANSALDRASALYRLERYEEALPAYERAIELAPDSAMLWKWHGRTLYQLKRYEEGVASCQRAIDLDAADAQAWFFLGLSYEGLKRHEERLDAYSHAIALNEGNPQYWTAKGSALHALRRYDEAIAAYKRAITLNPQYYAAWGNLGATHIVRRRFQEALEALDRALEIEPKYAVAISNKGAALLALERYEDALTALDEALQLDSQNPLTWEAKTMALANMQRYEEAYDASQQALHLAPDDAGMRDTAARIRADVKRDVPDQRVTLRDGRTLGYIEVGDAEGAPVFFFHGLPGSRLDGIWLANTCRALRIRLICPDRPGMGLSDYQRRRRLRDWPADVAQLADTLGIERFVVAGVSGGGPYALACAYALPERVLVAGVISTMGPHRVRGALRAMPWRSRVSAIAVPITPWPLVRIGAAVSALLAQGDPARVEYSARWRHGDIDKFSPSSPLPQLPPTRREAIAEPFREGGRGYAREMRIAVHRWGFRLERIKPPVLLWHGERDPFTPAVVGRYLAARIPGCQATFYAGEKHFVINAHEREILATLAAAGQES